MEIEEYITQEIMAFIPIYMDMKGNCTLLYTTKGGEIALEKCTRTILNLLSKYYLVDLKESKKYYSSLIGIKNSIPIPFNRENILIPVKVRKPILRNDGSLGYINLKYIEKIAEGKNCTTIYLENNHKILSLNTFKTIEKQIKLGHIVKRFCEEKEGIVIKESEEGPSFYTEYNKLATKADIALVMNEIMSIKEYLT